MPPPEVASQPPAVATEAVADHGSLVAVKARGSPGVMTTSKTGSFVPAGVTAATRAPAGGEIHDGVFVDAARGLVEKSIPQPTLEQQDQALAKSQEILLGYGVTGVGAMSTSVADWQTFRRAGEAGRLQVRLMSYLTGTEAMQAVPHPTDWLYGDRLRASGIKLFADGALGSR